jgi:hypothetical protein
MSDKLFFTVITVTDELNAYKVFETLNARGVRLSATDLLKNYLFSVLHRENQHEHELKVLEDRWEAMVGRLGSESFPDFLRVHWNSRKAFVRQTELFKTIRGQVNSRDAVFSLIRDMEQDLDTYLALSQPATSHWPDPLKKYASLLRMFNVRQPFPLLLAARRVLDDGDFETLLRASMIISFRYNVIGGLHTGEQERVYNAVAQSIATRNPSLGDILAGLKPVYFSDDSFKTAFADKIIRTHQSRNKGVVRYILCELEQRLSGMACDFDSEAFNIEHILPENPSDGWGNFTDEELDAMVFRLGNMTLLRTTENRDLANKTYSGKRQVYDRSGFLITKKIAEENAEWNAERITARQRWMANQACTIWRVDQLS